MNESDVWKIERELTIIIPFVFIDFLKRAANDGIDVSRESNPMSGGVFTDIEECISENLALREDWDADHDLFAPGFDDGCGNFFAIRAGKSDDDEMCIIAHDPPGIEPLGPASEFFDDYLDNARSQS
ncbi:MAG TPA: hypothetical protein DDW52_20990 [Planctomycetaceae bacterium]|nr:hypothetical protein [Planctomycetaceae bacterium]